MQHLRNSINRRRALSRGALARQRPHTHQKTDYREKLYKSIDQRSAKKDQIIDAIEKMDENQIERLSRQIEDSIKGDEPEGNFNSFY
jgi:hypothetical protein